MGLGEIIANPGMRAMWRFDNNANDSSGNGRTLTVSGATYGLGAFGYSYNGNLNTTGTTNRFSLGTNPFSSTTPSVITLAFYFRLQTSGSSNANARLFEICANTAGGTALSASAVYNISAGNITFTFTTLYVTTNVQFTKTYTSDFTIRNFVVLIDTTNKTMQAYIDGQSVGSGTGTGNLTCPTGTYPFTIGISRTGTSGQAWAVFDEFVLEERLWSQSEIQKYYTDGKGLLSL